MALKEASERKKTGELQSISDFIADHLALQESEREIVRAVGNKYNLNDEAARMAVREVWTLWNNQPSGEYEARRQQLRLSFANLYKRCLEDGSYNAALGALDRLARLDGLFAPTRTQIDVRGASAITEAAPDRIRDRMRAILEKRPELAEMLLTPVKKDQN